MLEAQIKVIHNIIFLLAKVPIMNKSFKNKSSILGQNKFAINRIKESNFRMVGHQHIIKNIGAKIYGYVKIDA
jgi:hypothetical protein